ncbi:MAG TPA: ABC transporter ATP-binding protein [Polyangia bacterium]|nr:ABC transporter ATP-binding protein [Polyangia bacterium]
MLHVDHLSVSYGQSQVIPDFSLSVKKDEIVAVMGRNGMGKTTLFKAMIGILPVKAGRVEVGGKDVTAEESYDRVADGLGYVPQGRMVFPTLTVEENIEAGLRTSKERVPPELYEFFPVLLEMKKRRAGNLSGGQQQQLVIARALASKPKVLLLDEPTEGIQPSIIEQIGDTLKKLKVSPISEEEATAQARRESAEIQHAVKELKREHSLAILLVEQFVDFCRDVADRFYAMDRGAVVISGPIASLTDDVVKEHLQV